VGNEENGWRSNPGRRGSARCCAQAEVQQPKKVFPKRSPSPVRGDYLAFQSAKSTKSSKKIVFVLSCILDSLNVPHIPVFRMACILLKELHGSRQS
jgi:hypothetical protein